MLCALPGLWVQIDAFSHPDRDDLTIHQEFPDVGSIVDCRATVSAAAVMNGDPDMLRGDYECGAGPTGKGFGGMKVYGETVR